MDTVRAHAKALSSPPEGNLPTSEGAKDSGSKTRDISISPFILSGGPFRVRNLIPNNSLRLIIQRTASGLWT
ncbi:hypothetical protein H2248_012358 [Termitomyces sp. 'cryptogamus']|nr:hypothetical protein H2248_012358 [Termitomyces sp. 'cryptogamus']